MLDKDGWVSEKCSHNSCGEGLNSKEWVAQIEAMAGHGIDRPKRKKQSLRELLAELGVQDADVSTEGATVQKGTITWEGAASELDEIRKGEEEYEDDKGNSKTRQLHRHIVQENVYQFVLAVMGKKAQLFRDAYPYVFLPEEQAIYKFHNEKDAYSLLSRFRLRLAQSDYQLVHGNLDKHIQMYGKPTRIEKLGNYRGGRLYVNNGRGGMFRIGPDEISGVPNGADGVLMLDPKLLPWPELDACNLERIEEISRQLGGAGGGITPDSKLCKHLNAMFEEGNLKSAQYQQLVLLRYLSLFVGEALKLRPLMMATGEQNSGKSTLWEKFMWLLEGPDYESEALPANLRSFVAAITNNAAKIFDNIDSVNFENPRSEYPQYIDLMCKSATGGTLPIAQLYQTNVENTYGLRCDIFLTARVNPFPSHRSDLLRRTLTFPIRKPEQHEYITVERMQQDLMTDREEMLLETLVRLRNVLRGMEANRGKCYPPISEMHSYETWTMMIADHEGWGEEHGQHLAGLSGGLSRPHRRGQPPGGVRPALDWIQSSKCRSLGAAGGNLRRAEVDLWPGILRLVPVGCDARQETERKLHRAADPGN